MYNMLIVDDNKFIVNGLNELFQHMPELTLQLSCAYSPYQALKLVEKSSFDIALIDIMMGDISGFELQHEIHLRWPKCKVIFLTAYDRFDYIKKALKNEACGYVLKNEGEEEIIAVVKKAIDEIAKMHESENMIINARQYVSTALPMLRKDYIFDLINGQCDLNNAKKEFQKLGIALDPEKTVIMALSKVNSDDKILNQRRLEVLINEIAEYFKEEFKCDYTYSYFSYGNLRLLSVLQPVSSNSENMDAGNKLSEKRIKNIKQHFNNASEKLSKLNKICIQTLVAEKWSNLYEPQTLDELEERTFNIVENSDENFFLDNQDEIRERDADFEIEILNQSKHFALLKDYLKNRQVEKSQAEVANLMGSKLTSMFEYRLEIYYTIVSIYLHFINKWQICLKNGEAIDFSALINAYKHNSWDSIKKYFIDLAEVICLFKTTNDVTSSNYEIVLKAQQYIDSNLGSELSLNRIAKHVSYNPSYLSRLYKQLTGEGMFDYINRLKLIKAKELLVDDKYKIQEISTILGFENTSNFIRFFKKCTKMSPAKYRAEIGATGEEDTSYKEARTAN